MFRRIAKFLLVMALASSIGLHWVALQSVAWTTMLVGNLHQGSIAQALQRTFDGRHPCPLCQAIAKGKNCERKSASVAPLKKFEFPPSTALARLIIPAQFPAVVAPPFFCPLLRASPPTPPPRNLLA
ncbi:MAG TPA: hypothetical protein VHB20_07745 [Verrucomicrobiae bacterium]|nr:hypothetical protein [Verrucomicrobiae bacterium]